MFRTTFYHNAEVVLSALMRCGVQCLDDFYSPDYSPTREIDQRRPFWRPDDPRHNHIPGSS
jgi:hypothetical protein